MKNQNRGSFGSSFGAMMAVAGSAVGLGNIWRFPYMAGENGGAAFLIVYLVLVLIVGLPLVLSEFSIGRSTHQGVVRSFKVLAPGKKWYMVGYVSLIAGITILGFYSVIAGWTIRFLTESVSGNFIGASSSDIATSFNAFKNDGYGPILYAIGFIGVTAWVILRGVEKGIEKYNKILMPSLVVLLVLLCVNSMTLEGFGRGMEFLFTPDFSKITIQTIFEALGQVFFTLSVGMGVMLTYSSYVKKDENMVRSKGIVTIIDTSIAILAGVAIFPAVFTFGIEPTQGPALVFLALPSIFAQLPFGSVVAAFFFSMLFIAALTSAISIFEMIVAYSMEEFRISRVRAVVYVASVLTFMATLSALSQMEGSSLVLFGYNVFDFLDMVSSNYLLIGGGMLISIFVGWVFRKDKLYSVFTGDGRYFVWLFRPFVFVTRYVVPTGVSMLFLSKLGVL